MKAAQFSSRSIEDKRSVDISWIHPSTKAEIFIYFEKNVQCYLNRSVFQKTRMENMCRLEQAIVGVEVKPVYGKNLKRAV